MIKIKRRQVEQALNLPIKKGQVPVQGWIKTIRDCLGVNLNYIAKKLGIGISAVKNYERNEQSKTITLQSLEKVADTMDCKLVYFFVPKDGSLEKLIDRKAKEVALKIYKRTSHTMTLEKQSVKDESLFLKDMVEELKNDKKLKNLWN